MHITANCRPLFFIFTTEHLNNFQLNIFKVLQTNLTSKFQSTFSDVTTIQKTQIQVVFIEQLINEMQKKN